MSYEEPGYSVITQSGPVEYRRYQAYLVAETLVADRADFDSAGNEGFRRLFKYIAGGNTSQSRITMTAPVSQAAQPEKIAMTVPVQQQGAAAGWRIAFMLPAQYTIETAPKPSDVRVQVTAVPARLVAVLRYSGRWTEGNYLQHRDELLQGLSQAGIKPSGEPWLARYNGPFSLPFLRRNEVLIKVDRVPD
ncbi:MAG: heme-binding protein [Gammaproteobacteria bacterium]|nr:heme-binding protein [Gammaproteobacteria bacterium]